MDTGPQTPTAMVFAVKSQQAIRITFIHNDFL